MDIRKCSKGPFSVIGKEGCTDDGAGFIAKLWEEANGNFHEIEAMAKRDRDGNFAGFWGAMSDATRNFRPWEDGFSKGLYLAGAEVNDDAAAPKGWVRWRIPSYEYLYVKAEADGSDTFSQMLLYLEEQGLSLAGAVHEFISPTENGQLYLFFPIRRL